VITFKQYLEEARYQSSQGTDNGRKVVNAALEAVPKLKEAGEQVFVANFKEIAPGDSDIFLKTYKELLDRFGEPDWIQANHRRKTLTGTSTKKHT
jgi:hypothetical protein